MAAKTQTKTEIRNNTAKAQKLLRGIDNETVAIKKDQEKLNARVKAVQESTRVVQTLIGGISNAALAAPSAQKPAPAQAKKPAAKPQAQAKKPAAKVRAKPQAKKPAAKAQAKPAQKAAPKAQAKKPAAKAAPKADKPKAPVSNRPPLKKVITDILAKNGKPMGAAEIYKEACQKFGYWSRQSLYNALKDARSFSKDGDGFRAASPKSTTTDVEAEDFVKKVEGNAATSTVV